MKDDFIRNTLATTAVISTVVQFLSGLLVCRRIVRKRSTGDLSPFPFISGHLSVSLWLQYGFLINDFSLIFVNTIGAALFLGYTVVFYYYSIKRSVLVKQFAVCLTILGAATIYCQWNDDIKETKTHIGILCSIVTVIFFAAPLTSIFHVLRVKNTDSLPYPIILSGFIVCSQWYAYGVLLNDTFIQLPNFLGAVLTLCQLSLFCIYPSKNNYEVESV